MKRSLASAVALASLVSIGTGIPAYSADFESLLRTFMGAYQPPGGTPSSMTQQVIKTNINTRQAQLEQEIAAGVTSGQITATEEADLKAELNRVASLEGTYLADGSLSNTEVQSLLEQLTNVTRRLNTYLTNTAVVGTSTPQHDYWFKKYGGPGSGSGPLPNQAQRIAHIDSRQAELDSGIEQGVMSGSLSWNDTTSLRAELNRIRASESTFMADGRLSYSEQQQLNQSLDALDSRLKESLENQRWRGRGRKHGHHKHDRDRNRDIDTQQSLLRQRIYRGVSSGRLTQFEANRLLRDEQSIAEMEARLRLSGGQLTMSEQRRLLAELDYLSKTVNKELNDKQVQ